jgi:hypothetical protein
MGRSNDDCDHYTLNDCGRVVNTLAAFNGVQGEIGNPDGALQFFATVIPADTQRTGHVILQST